MTSDQFRIEPYSQFDKRIHITGPDELRLEVDFDDVDHEPVELHVERLVAVLNQNWGVPQ